jgi:hypothetical protein
MAKIIQAANIAAPADEPTPEQYGKRQTLARYVDEDQLICNEYTALSAYIDTLLQHAEANLKTLQQEASAVKSEIAERMIRLTALITDEKARVATMHELIRDMHARIAEKRAKVEEASTPAAQASEAA